MSTAAAVLIAVAAVGAALVLAGGIALVVAAWQGNRPGRHRPTRNHPAYAAAHATRVDAEFRAITNQLPDVAHTFVMVALEEEST